MMSVSRETKQSASGKGDWTSLLRALDALDEPAGAMPAHSGKVMDGQPILEGSRNNALTRIAGRLRYRGASEEAIATTLLDTNDTQCSPPLDEAEVRAIAASVGRYPVPRHRQLGMEAQVGQVIDPYNDTANALRFVRLFGHDLMYVPANEQWYIWMGDRWNCDSSFHRIECAKQVGAEILAEAMLMSDPTARSNHEKFARKSGDLARVKAMVELAKSDHQLIAEDDSLDKHDELLGVSNGVLNLRRGKLQQNERALRITRYSPVVFDPAAKCPTFYQFINRIMVSAQWPKYEPRRIRARRIRGLIRFLQRLVGYALSGRTDEQKLLFLFGNGANGKTTFLKVVEDLLGNELSRQLPYDSLMAQKQVRSATNDIARLRDVRAVFTNEVEEGTFLAESLIKQLTGGDAISARMLYREFQEFTPKFKLFIAGNHKPVIKGDDEGIWRRLTLIPFQAHIPPSEQDPQLLLKLRSELPGILNWAVQGYRMWLREGLNPPECVMQASLAYRDEMDLMGQWIQESCQIAEDKLCSASAAYTSYSLWASAQGLKPMSNAAFGRKLSARFERKRVATGSNYHGFDCGGCQGSRPAAVGRTCVGCVGM